MPLPSSTDTTAEEHTEAVSPTPSPPAPDTVAAAPKDEAHGPRHAFGSYEAEFVEGDAADCLVIAVSGVRGGTPITGFDFYFGLLRRPQADRLFLRDQKRSWYNTAEGWDDLASFIAALAAAKPYRRIAVIGVSMGAYGALLLGALLPQAVVVAMAPPIGVDTARFGRYAVRYKQWLDLGEALPRGAALLTGDPARHLLLFGDQDVIDLENARRFHAAGWPGLFMLPDGPHALSVQLQQRRQLDPFLDALIAGAPTAELAALCGAHAVHAHCQAFRLLAARDHLFAGEWAAADTALADAAAAPWAPQQLAVMRLLRLGLGAVGPRQLAAFAALPATPVTLTLDNGWQVEATSAESRVIGSLLLLGPLARLVLRAPDPAMTGRVRFSALPGAPPVVNRGGRQRINALARGKAGAEVLAFAQTPAETLRVERPLARGEAVLWLHRRSFYSDFDARRSEQRITWSMKLSQIAVTPVEDSA
ncbi:hypothetical protein [Roseomonas sp. 18066]|uniref:hypothetical protein n=1 Tax=Roseomonas sp. 18066 TaxID=2681412 RepID=UPI00135AA287|nr:hypothetical protein [Roseomonas sp. 18066]